MIGRIALCPLPLHLRVDLVLLAAVLLLGVRELLILRLTGN